MRWKRKLGYARRDLAGVQPRHRLRRAARAHARLEGRPRRRGVGEERPHAAGRASCPAARSPRRCSTAAGCSSAPRTAPSTRCARATARCAGRYKAAGAVKGALALDARQALLRRLRRQGPRDPPRRRQARSGRSTASGRRARARRRATSTRRPAVAYGRVYIGSTNGDVYSFARADGKLAWRKRTGDYVYASPAVGTVRGGRPTVYVGSYDGRFYALDARTRQAALGRARWARRSPAGRRSSATSSSSPTSTSARPGRSARSTGKTVWKTRRGAFNPVDQRRPADLLRRLLVAVRARPRGPPVRPAQAPRRRRGRAAPRRRSARRRAAPRAAARRARAAPRAAAPRAARAHARRARAQAPPARRTATATRAARRGPRALPSPPRTSTPCAAKRLVLRRTATATRTPAPSAERRAQRAHGDARRREVRLRLADANVP